MDLSSYAQAFLRAEDLPRDRPLKVTIDHVKDGKYDKPDLHFTDGSILSLNKSNARTLVRAYGRNSDSWKGAEVELTVGETTYQDEPKATIVVRPISPPGERAPAPTPTPTPTPFDDKIPF